MATIIEQARASGNNDMALDAGINFRAPPILPLTMPQAGRIKPLISLQCAADSLLPKNVLTLRNTGGQRTNIQALAEAPEMADKLASDYSLALQEKYLKLKLKAPTSLSESRNLRKQLNELTKQISLKLVHH